MQRVIDAVRQHHADKRRSLKVPEWDAVELFFGPITVADMDSVDRRKPDSNTERQLYLLISKAKNIDGKPLFNYGDFKILKDEADLTVLSRIFAFMWENEGLTPNEADEVLEKDPLQSTKSPLPESSE